MRTSAPIARETAARALAALRREFGEDVPAIVKIVHGDALEVRFSFSLGGAAERDETEKAIWDQFCGSIAPELKPEHYGMTVILNGLHYRLAGILPNRPTRPIKLVSVATGKLMICRGDAAVLGLRRSGHL